MSASNVSRVLDNGVWLVYEVDEDNGYMDWKVFPEEITALRYAVVRGWSCVFLPYETDPWTVIP